MLQPHLVQQAVQRCLRRRTTSHEVRKGFRRTSPVVLALLSGVSASLGASTVGRKPSTDNPTQAKLPSRYTRRRGRNLLAHFGLRAGGRWLPSGLQRWHAKRMHVRPLWGLQIPASAKHRGCRAAVRFAAHHCTVQDLTFMRTIQLTGAPQTLCAVLAAVCRPTPVSSKAEGPGCESCTTPFLTKDINFMRGRFEWEGVLCAAGPAVSGTGDTACVATPLCPVRVLWRLPATDGGERELSPSVWLTLHPGAAEVATALVSAQTSKHPRAACTVEDVSDRVLRLRLTGPDSMRALHSSLSGASGLEKPGVGGIGAGLGLVPQCLAGSVRTSFVPSSSVGGVTAFALQMSAAPSLMPKGQCTDGPSPSAAKQSTAHQRFSSVADFNRYAMRAASSSTSTGAAETGAKQQQLLDMPLDLKSHLMEAAPKQRGGGLAEQGALLVCTPLVGARAGVSGSSAVVYPAWDVIVIGRSEKAAAMDGGTTAGPGGIFKRLFLAVHMAGARAIGLEEQHRIQTEAGVATFPYDFAGTAAFDDDARADALQMCRTIGSRRKGHRFPTFPKLSSSFDGIDAAAATASEMPVQDGIQAVRTAPCTPLLPTWLVSLSGSSKLPHGDTMSLVGGNVRVLQKGHPSRLTRIYLPTADEMADFVEHYRAHNRAGGFVRHSVPFSTVVVSQRAPVGCLTSGVFSRACGKGTGIGYVDCSKSLWAHCQLAGLSGIELVSKEESKPKRSTSLSWAEAHLVLLHNSRSTVLRPALFYPWQ